MFCNVKGSFHLQIVPSPISTHHSARTRFSRWYLDQCREEAHFPPTSIYRRDVFYARWCVQLPQCALFGCQESPRHETTCCSISLFIAFFSWYVFDLIPEPTKIDTCCYTFNVCRLSHLYARAPSKRMWPLSHAVCHILFQYDGTPSHNGRYVPKIWIRCLVTIGLGEWIVFLATSLSWFKQHVFCFFFGGGLHLKCVCNTHGFDMDLIIRIVCGAADKEQNPGVVQRAR